MAKPGSDAARVLAGAHDLSLSKLSDEQAREVQEGFEMRLGARCGGCGRRIGVGMRFTSIDPRSEKQVLQLSACSRDDCDFAERARDGATFCEMVEFAWVDENGLGAPPALMVLRRRASELEARAAEGGNGGQQG